MSNKEILEKAIQKAIDGGWITFVTYKVTDDLGAWAQIMPEKGKDWQSKIIYWQPFEAIIFNKDFAKAIWGDKSICIYCHYQESHDDYYGKHDPYCDNKRDNNYYEFYPEYCYHLQQMAIADDPIKYLGDNI